MQFDEMYSKTENANRNWYSKQVLKKHIVEENIMTDIFQISDLRIQNRQFRNHVFLTSYA